MYGEFYTTYYSTLNLHSVLDAASIRTFLR